MRIAHQIVASVGTGNQCYTVADKQLNAYGKWAGCPGGSGPGYSSTMRYMPYENSSGLGPNIGGSICNCTYLGSAIYPPVNTVAPVISGNPHVLSTLTCSSGTWTGTPTPTLSYQWYSGNTLIPGQTTNSYVTQPADIGQSITCQVTGSNAGGSIVVTSNIITPLLVTPQTVTFTGTVNFEIIYVNSSNQVVTATGPVLNGFTIYRVTATSAGASYVINSYLPSTSISFLIVGGGGTGSGDGGQAIVPGAGGAGGFIDSSGTTNTAAPYLIYVGMGGVASNNTANGETSLLQLTSGILTAIGGGGGGNLSTSLNGLNGGSGGGGAFNFNNNNSGTGGNGTPGQGFSGSGSIGGAYAGSGGGAGGNAYLNGGPGLSSTITGQIIFYAGGGGGIGRLGGSGGGGQGGVAGLGTSGTDGLGGGGGSPMTSGGSGVVILRIPSFA